MDNGPVLIADKIVHIDLQPGYKHDIKQAYRSEKNHALVTKQDVEAVRTENYAGHDQYDKIRNLVTSKGNGSQQDDKKHQRKY